MVSVPESSPAESTKLKARASISVSSDNTGLGLRALSARQERRLVEYVEDMFLDIMRNYKKRDHPSTTLATLHSYLRSTHTLLSLILQIPPIAQNQAALRIALLLRFTSETLSAIPRYPCPVFGNIVQRRDREGEIGDGVGGAEVLRELLNWLDELDRGWHAVLCSKAWDPDAHEGVDVDVHFPQYGNRSSHSSSEPGSQGGVDEDEDFSPSSLSNSANSLSQTDRTRLRSLLLSGTSGLEEWLEGLRPTPSTSTRRVNNSCLRTNGDQEKPEDLDLDEAVDLGGVDDLETTLEHLGLQQAFDGLFSRTLASMGELGGEVLISDEELEME